MARGGLLLLALVLPLLAAPSSSGAQSGSEDIPANAHGKSYGSGWECDSSNRARDGKCVSINLPANAFLTNQSYGRGWACMRGFKEVERSVCREVPVPAGGYLTPSGESWKCLRGYYKSGDECERVVVPENAYLTDDPYGPPWKCNRGFVAVDAVCQPIRVPENGYLTNSSHGPAWACERGFYKVESSCVAVAVPANGYFHESASRAGWRCERGYSISGDLCVAIDLPENAHLDRSGNRWECNRGFKLYRRTCVPDS